MVSAPAVLDTLSGSASFSLTRLCVQHHCPRDANGEQRSSALLPLLAQDQFVR